MYIFSPEETGLMEMYELVRYSGGLLVLGQEFSGEDKTFENSFKKVQHSMTHRLTSKVKTMNQFTP